MLQNHRHLNQHSSLVLLDMFSAKLQQQFDLSQQSLMPLIEDVRREYIFRIRNLPHMVGQSIVFNDRILNFERKSLILDLLQCMTAQPSQQLSLDDIINQVYQTRFNRTSPRQQQALRNTAGKLILRTRKILAYHLDDTTHPEWQWLAYDSCSKHYVLVRPLLKILPFH